MPYGKGKITFSQRLFFTLIKKQISLSIGYVVKHVLIQNLCNNLTYYKVMIFFCNTIIPQKEFLIFWRDITDLTNNILQNQIN